MSTFNFDDLAPYDPIAIAVDSVLFTPSDQQADIFNCGLGRDSHIRVIARAGTGKTTTSMEFIAALVREVGRNLRIVVVQFNKSIQREAQAKIEKMGLADCATALTFHSIGNSALYKQFGKLPIDEYRTEHMLPVGTSNEVKQAVPRVVSLCKNNLIAPDELDEIMLENLALEFDIDLEDYAARVLELSKELLTRSMEDVTTIDYDDMLWLPIVLGLPVRRADLLIVDESQDLNEAQRQMALKMIGTTGRLMFIGDPRQAIYAFRGASHTSMDDLAELLLDSGRGLETFPLTVTRRCPKLVVQLAQQLVPDFVAHDDAPQGEIRIALPNEQPVKGDLVLCRVNAPLVSTAYDLIRHNIPARIQGRDIGQGLTRLINKLAKPDETTDDLLDELETYEAKERERIMRRGQKVERKLAALEDKVQCIEACCGGCEYVHEVLTRIGALFANIEAGADHSHYVLLSTVHKAKGMEADVVRILHPELIPHPMAKGPARDQELNIMYVAITRTKRVLIFHGDPIALRLPAETAA